MSEIVNIFTDGACRGNPGLGGWGALIIKNNEEYSLWGGERNTTNNKMEMTAAIKALEYFEQPTTLKITTDSNYVKDGIEKWISNWKKNDWKTSARKPVKNKELWIRLDDLINKHNVVWKWVKGHAGNKYNNKADSLARNFIEDFS